MPKAVLWSVLALMFVCLADAQPTCADGSTPKCGTNYATGTALGNTRPPCSTGSPGGICQNGENTIPPAGSGGTGTATGGGTGTGTGTGTATGGGTGGGTGTGPGTGGPTGGGTGGGGGGGTPSSSSPHAASMLGDVGRTTATGSDIPTGAFFDVGENIYGPFEAGFGAEQDFILEGLGCVDPTIAFISGGIDTFTAEKMTSAACNVELPRWEGAQYISLLDLCGGHTREYHFHERLDCLYDKSAPGHSTQVGATADGSQFIYGMYEDTNVLPMLDACGGHFGPTPDNGYTYHYHVQEKAPFVIGCFGPTDNGNLVTVEECRSYYSGCGDGDEIDVTTPEGTWSYDLWCPCYDANGMNMGEIAQLPVFAPQSGVSKDPNARSSSLGPMPSTSNMGPASTSMGPMPGSTSISPGGGMPGGGMPGGGMPNATRRCGMVPAAKVDALRSKGWNPTVC